MKQLVENMLKPSLFNWMDLLRAAELLHLRKLKAAVLCFLRDNFHVLQSHKLRPFLAAEGAASSDGPSPLEQLKDEFPTLFGEILEMRAQNFPAPPSQLLIEEGQRTKESSLSEDRRPFPFWALAMAAISLFFYQYATQILPMGPIVPVVNGLGFLVLLVYGFRSLSG